MNATRPNAPRLRAMPLEVLTPRLTVYCAGGPPFEVRPAAMSVSAATPPEEG